MFSSNITSIIRAKAIRYILGFATLLTAFFLLGAPAKADNYAVTVTANVNPTTIALGQSTTGRASAIISPNPTSWDELNGVTTPTATFSIVSVVGTSTSDTLPTATISSDGSGLTVTAGATTTPDVYTVTVKAAYKFTDSTGATVTPSNTATVSVSVVSISGLQCQKSDGSWENVSGTLYVLKGSSVTFRAIPTPVGASFPGGTPTWGGSAGVSGGGVTQKFTANTLSQSIEDLQTITVGLYGSSDTTLSNPFVIFTANVVVYDLKLSFTPDTSTADSSSSFLHSKTAMGIGETGTISYLLSPSDCPLPATIVSLTHSSGYGSLIAANYIAGAIAYSDTFTLKFQNDLGSYARTLTQSIEIPTSIIQVRYDTDTKTYHDGQQDSHPAYPSAGSYRRYSVSPSDVSFDHVKTWEVDSQPSSATGLWTGCSYWHIGGASQNTNPPQAGYIYDPNFSKWVLNAKDAVGTLVLVTCSDYTGSCNYNITLQYSVDNDTSENIYYLASVSEDENSSSSGEVTISKGTVPDDAPLGMVYVGPFLAGSTVFW